MTFGNAVSRQRVRQEARARAYQVMHHINMVHENIVIKVVDNGMRGEMDALLVTHYLYEGMPLMSVIFPFETRRSTS